jgi:hypothetical protein
MAFGIPKCENPSRRNDRKMPDKNIPASHLHVIPSGLFIHRSGTAQAVRSVRFDRQPCIGAAVTGQLALLRFHRNGTAQDASPQTTSKMGVILSICPIPRSRTLPGCAALPSRRILAQLRKIFAIHKHIASNTLRSYPPKDIKKPEI